MIHVLFMLGVVFIPFTAIDGWKYLGESKHEVSSYIFLTALMLSVIPMLKYFSLSNNAEHHQIKIYALPQIMALMFAVIFMSFIANFAEIQGNIFHGRGGLEKFVSSVFLVGYGFALAHLTYFVAEGKKWDKLIVRPMAISVFLCAIFAVFEISARWYGLWEGGYDLLTKVVYGNMPTLEWDYRLRTVAFEPPDFANTCGYLWPWMLSGVMFSKGGVRKLLFIAFLALNIMLFLSESRTGMVVVAGLATVFLALRIALLPPHRLGDPDKMVLPVTIVCMLVMPILLILLVNYFDDIVFSIIEGDRVSNISRLSSMTAAFNMFEVRPIFGFGFGQFAYHIMDYMPSWGYHSWEIRYWLLEDMNYWPAVYSVYARFAADMGVLGVLMWAGLWLWLARAVLVNSLVYRKITGDLPFAAYPLIMSCFCVLLSGVSVDSVRSPMIWINLGLVCRYLYETRKAVLLPARA